MVFGLDPREAMQVAKDSLANTESMDGKLDEANGTLDNIEVLLTEIRDLLKEK